MTHVPQEYPKMVPGPDGPTVVQDQQEERRVLAARLGVLVARPLGVGLSGPDVAAWIAARRAPQRDWIAALHRPYVPVA